MSVARTLALFLYVECAPRQLGGHEEDMHLVLPAHSSISLVLRQPAAAVVPRDLNGSPKKLIAIATNSTNSTFMVPDEECTPPGRVGARTSLVLVPKK